MRKVTVLLIVLLSLLSKVTFAENISSTPKLFDYFTNSFSESVTEKKALFSLDACTEEESYNTPWKCQDNYYFLDNDGEEYYLHKKQNDELKHILLESNLKAVGKTDIGQRVSGYFSRLFRAKIGQELDGNIFVILPGVKEDIEKIWELSLKPKVYRLDDDFGYNLGCEIDAIFFDDFSLNANWRFEEDEHNFRFGINATFFDKLSLSTSFKFAEDELDSGISYKIANNKNLNVIAQKSNHSEKFWAFFSWQF